MKWEYKKTHLFNELRELVEKGWELVTVSNAPSIGCPEEYVLKRPLEAGKLQDQIDAFAQRLAKHITAEQINEFMRIETAD